MSTRTCQIPSAAINGSPYLVAWGSSIFAKVAASNVYGISEHSVAGNGAVIVTVPDAPIGVADNAVVTTATRIGITWQRGASNGGTPIIDYRVSWDQGTGTWVVR